MCGIFFEVGLFVIGVYTLATGEFQYRIVYHAKRVVGTRVLPIGLLFMLPLAFGIGATCAIQLFAGSDAPDLVVYSAVIEWVLMAACPLIAVAYAARIGQDAEVSESERDHEARQAAASTDTSSSSGESPSNGTARSSHRLELDNESGVSGSTPAEWRCSDCGETVPDDLEVCWNCLNPRGTTR